MRIESRNGETTFHVERREIDVEPLSILPCQLDDRLFGLARRQPEKRLQLAVLEDAILTFHRFFGIERTRARRLFAEIEDWFASEETASPFTFVTICDTLNIDPDYIRSGLRRWRARIDTASKRTTPFRRERTGLRHRVASGRIRRVA